MSYVTDFEKTADIGDYRYFVTRVAGATTVERHLLRGERLDDGFQREAVPEEEIPTSLAPLFLKLRAGDMPAVA